MTDVVTIRPPPHQELSMNFVGIDLHKKTITLAVLDHTCRLLQRRSFRCQDSSLIRSFFLSLQPFQAVVEATAAYDWLVALLDPLATKPIVLAHPGKLRLIADSVKKTDRLDALVLAEFLVRDLIPQAYRPTARQRQHRVLVRHRVAARRRVSTLKCRLRHLLSNFNADRKDLFTAAGRDYLRQLELPAADRFVVEQLLTDLEQAQTQLAKATKQLRQFAAEAPGQEREDRAILRTIPGVGEVVAEVVLAELGTYQRFGSQKKVCAYAGLVPTLRESGGRSSPQGITKQGSRLLRWILVEAAWQAVRYSRRWAGVYERLKARKGAQRAIVAVARRLLGVMLALLKSGRSYQLAHQERIGKRQGEGEAAL
jgi:transposase